MTKTRLILAATLLAGTAFPAFAQNNSQANVQTALNTPAASDGNVAINSEPSPTQRKGTHLSASQRAKADAAEAETTRQLNQQAAVLAKPGNT